MHRRAMGDADIEALADSARSLLRELALVHAEGESLRRELEMAWGTDDDDFRPTLVPGIVFEVDERDERRDTLPCAPAAA
jgi:hypothetical protein